MRTLLKYLVCLCCASLLSLMAQNVPASEQPDALNSLRRDAENGDPEAQEFLGLMYLNGDKVPRDKKEGCRWLLAATKKNAVIMTLYNKHCHEK
ncbi:MAG: hypothetical protein LBI88_02065 [Deltaproteobacteria bacterium]|jgi:TPR repeat protein|nr:hypothetical protein [Deltaproteobacteria bacterium]